MEKIIEAFEDQEKTKIVLERTHLKNSKGKHPIVSFTFKKGQFNEALLKKKLAALDNTGIPDKPQAPQQTTELKKLIGKKYGAAK